jgi:hypothetical protein
MYLSSWGAYAWAVYGPEHRLGAQVTGATAGEEPLLPGLQVHLSPQHFIGAFETYIQS